MRRSIRAFLVALAIGVILQLGLGQPLPRTDHRGKKALASAPATRLLRPMTDQTAIEERIAHLTRMVEDLSDVVARQERDIALLTRRVAMLIEREVDRETGGGTPAADQRPPHW